MKNQSHWEVYIVRTKTGKFYTGITTDLDRRFSEHQEKRKGARFFRISNAESIVFREPHPNRSEATKREISIKKMSRKQKIDLIELNASAKGSDLTS
jgi:putative endonuclease